MQSAAVEAFTCCSRPSGSARRDTATSEPRPPAARNVPCDSILQAPNQESRAVNAGAFTRCITLTTWLGDRWGEGLEPRETHCTASPVATRGRPSLAPRRTLGGSCWGTAPSESRPIRSEMDRRRGQPAKRGAARPEKTTLDPAFQVTWPSVLHRSIGRGSREFSPGSRPSPASASSPRLTHTLRTPYPFPETLRRSGPQRRDSVRGTHPDPAAGVRTPCAERAESTVSPASRQRCRSLAPFTEADPCEHDSHRQGSSAAPGRRGSGRRTCSSRPGIP